ncbi:MAG: fibronectin type III domain-containing protein [Opitutaceae bacterium]|nr:fibronectin type III domain-containing protein [Opitutaceae bacterium]
MRKPKSAGPSNEAPEVDNEAFSSSISGYPVPFFQGEAAPAARWITPVYGQRTVETSQGGGKGGKGGGGKKTEYFGTIASVICYDGLDEIRWITNRGKRVWEGLIDRWSSPNPVTITLQGVGQADVYWGIAGQTTSAHLNQYEPHVPYPGSAILVLKDCSFGPNGETVAPDIKVCGRRSPRQTIVTGQPAAMDGHFSCNPVASTCEFLESWNWAGFPTARINAASFQAVANELQGETYGSRIATAVAPLITQTRSVRSILADISSSTGMWIRRANDGRIECGRWSRNPSALNVTTLGFEDLVEEPRGGVVDIDEVDNSFKIDFRNAEAYHKRDSVTRNCAAIIRRTGKVRRKTITRDDIHLKELATRVADELIREHSQPVLSREFHVRKGKCFNPNGTRIRPGDYFKAPVSKPGETLEVAMFRCIRRLVRMHDGVIVLSADRENSVSITPLPGADPEPLQVTKAMAPTVYARVVSLPPLQIDDASSITPLCARPSLMATESDLLYRRTVDDDFQSIGRTEYCLPLKLYAGINSSAGTVRVQLGGSLASEKDKHLLTTWSGGEQEGRDDQMLLVVVKKSGGMVASIPASSRDWVEVMSIKGPPSVVAAGVYDVPVFRGRLGTEALNFDGSSFPDNWSTYEVWALRRSQLMRFQHEDFNDLLGATDLVTFRFSAISQFSEYDPAEAWAERQRLTAASLPLHEFSSQPDATTFVGEIQFDFPYTFTAPPAAPTGLSASVGTGKLVQLTWTNLTGAQIQRYLVYRSTGPDYADEAPIGYDSDGRFHDANVVPGTTYRYRVRAQAFDEQFSDYSSSVTATPTAPPTAKLVTLTGTSQLFLYPKAGGVTPSSITITAVGQNLSGGPTFAIESGTATLDGTTGNSRTLNEASMATDTVTVRVDWDGQSDVISIAKVREGVDGSDGTDGEDGINGADAVVGYLTNEAHVLPSTASGVVSNWSNAFTDFKVYKGVNDDTSNWSFSKADGLNTASTISGNRVSLTALTADTGFVDITASRVGYTSITKRFRVTKSRTGLEAAPPAPAAPTLESSGTEVGSNGRILGFLKFNLPAMPAGAQWINYLYRYATHTGWVTADQRDTGGGTLVVPDLEPGMQVEFAAQAFSADANGSTTTYATGSPFTVPNKSTRPPAPTTIVTVAPVKGDGYPAAVGGASWLIYPGMWLMTPSSSDASVTKFEWRFGFSDPADNDAIGSNVWSITQSRTPVTIATVGLPSGFLYVRAIDAVGNRSTWLKVSAGSGLLNFSGDYSGNIVSEDKESARVTGLTTSTTLGSGRKVKAVCPFSHVEYIGPATEVSFNVPITGFSFKPDAGSVVCASDGDTICRYDQDAAGNSATNAVVKMKRRDGGTVPEAYYRVTGVFFAY